MKYWLVKKDLYDGLLESLNSYRQSPTNTKQQGYFSLLSWRFLPSGNRHLKDVILFKASEILALLKHPKLDEIHTKNDGSLGTWSSVASKHGIILGIYVRIRSFFLVHPNAIAKIWVNTLHDFPQVSVIKKSQTNLWKHHVSLLRICCGHLNTIRPLASRFAARCLAPRARFPRVFTRLFAPFPFSPLEM